MKTKYGEETDRLLAHATGWDMLLLFVLGDAEGMNKRKLIGILHRWKKLHFP